MTRYYNTPSGRLIELRDEENKRLEEIRQNINRQEHRTSLPPSRFYYIMDRCQGLDQFDAIDDALPDGTVIPMFNFIQSPLPTAGPSSQPTEA